MIEDEISQGLVEDRVELKLTLREPPHVKLLQ
jgi:hypothetical protein